MNCLAVRWCLPQLLLGLVCCGLASAQPLNHSDSLLTQPETAAPVDTALASPETTAPVDTALAQPEETAIDSTQTPAEPVVDSVLAPPGPDTALVSTDTSLQQTGPGLIISPTDSALQSGPSEMDVILGFCAPFMLVGGGFADGERTSEVGRFTYRNPAIHDEWAVGASIGLRRHPTGKNQGRLDHWQFDFFYLASHGQYHWRDTVSKMSTYMAGFDITGEMANRLWRFAPIAGVGGNLTQISTEGGATDSAGTKMTGGYNRLSMHFIVGGNTYIYDHLWLSTRLVWRPSGLQFLSVDDEGVDLSGEEDVGWLDVWFGVYWAFKVK